jgi:hypothetical protein
MKLFFILTLLFSALTVFGAKITDDVLKLGEPGSSANKVLKLGDTKEIRSNESTGFLEFTNDGSIYKKIGSGSGSGGSGGVNLLTNQSFEDPGSPILDWTGVGGTFSQEQYTNGVEGDLNHARLVATGAGQYFESDLKTVSDNLGFGCMSDVIYNQGDNAFKYEVLDATNTVLASGTFGDLDGWQKAPTLTFPCPNAGTQIKLRIESTGAGTIDVDTAYLGSNKGTAPVAGQKINTISQSGNGGEVVGLGTLVPVGSSTINGWDGSSYTIQDSGSIVQISGMYLFSNNTNRRTEVYLNGSSYKGTRSFTDDSIHNFYYTSSKGEFSQGDVISIRLSLGSGTLVNNPDFHYININEIRQENTLDTFSEEISSFLIKASLGGDNFGLSAGGTPAVASSSVLDMVLSKGSAKVPCSGGNPSTGLTCSVGEEQTGIVFNAPIAGDYETCFTWSGNSSGGGTTGFRINETQNNSDTILQTGEQYIASSSSNNIPFRHCQTHTFQSSGEKTVKLFLNNSGATFNFEMDRNAGTYLRDMGISVELKKPFINGAYVANQVRTSVKSGVRVESCRFTGGATPLIDSASGLCESWIDSVDARPGTGQLSVNFKTGVFSQQPVCTCTSEGDRHCAIIGGGTVSISGAQTITQNLNSNLENGEVHLRCIGKR